MAGLSDQLKAAGERLAAADAERAAAMQAAGVVAREAAGEVSVSEMARLLGVTRVTVYKMLDE